jgi:adenine-specific DNA-methyltransferase
MPTKQKLPLEILKEFLNKLFQFESQDLDFGVYKILHYKRNEIKRRLKKNYRF